MCRLLTAIGIFDLYLSSCLLDTIYMNFDLSLESGSNDLDFSEGSEDLEILLDEIIEAFDMPPGDDIDFPEIFSKQREVQSSNDPSDNLRRIQDAKRILNLLEIGDLFKVSIGDDGNLIIDEL